MTLRDTINKLLRRQQASASTARERLQLVLAHDRTDLSPDLLDQMRQEILEVVAKYVEIDMNEGAVSLETEDRMTALVANLPISPLVSEAPEYNRSWKRSENQTLTPKKKLDKWKIIT